MIMIIKALNTMELPTHIVGRDPVRVMLMMAMVMMVMAMAMAMKILLLTLMPLTTMELMSLS